MKPRWTHVLPPLIAVSALSVQAAEPEMMRGAKMRDRTPPAATLVVGANEQVGSIAEPGWPLIISALFQSEITPAPALPSGLRVSISDEQNREVAGIAFQPVPRPAGVTGEQSLYWLAPESATRALAPGLYRIRIAPGDGQATGFKFESAVVRVVTANGERRNLLSVLLIRRLLLLGRNDDALAEADRAIAADANDQTAWITKGDIFMQKDMPDEALEAYDQALSLHKKADGEPITITTRRRAAFFRSLEKRGVSTPPTPP